jgi:hypothetical protein
MPSEKALQKSSEKGGWVGHKPNIFALWYSWLEAGGGEGHFVSGIDSSHTQDCHRICSLVKLETEKGEIL